MVLVVDEETPEHLQQALEQLFENKEQLERFSHAAREAATSCFSPKLIQAEFMGYLHDLIDVEEELMRLSAGMMEPHNSGHKLKGPDPIRLCYSLSCWGQVHGRGDTG